MADIFISYSRKDRKTAERVAARLEREGWSVWWDRSLSAGERWDEAIRDELSKAACILVLWSQHSWNSKWVQAEAHAGFGRDALVAARIDGVGLQPPFNIIEAADLRERTGVSLERVVEGVRLKIRGSSTDKSSHARPDQASWALPPLQGNETKVRIVWQPTGFVLVRTDDGTVITDRRALSQDDLAKVPRDVEPCLFVNLEPNRGGLQSCIIAGPDSEVIGSMRAFWWSLARTKVVTTSAALYGAGIRGDQLAYVNVSARSMWESAIEQHPIVEMRDLLVYTRNIHFNVINDMLEKETDRNTRTGLHIALAMVLATQSEDRGLEGAAYQRFKKYIWPPGEEPPEFGEHDSIT